MLGDLPVVFNGRVHLEPPLPEATLPEPWNVLAEPNNLYINDGSATFTDQSATLAPAAAWRVFSIDLSDVDGDGDLDVVTAKGNVSLEEADRILTKNRVEKLLLVDENRKLTGLITIRDIDMMKRFPRACKDPQGRLRVGAAVGGGDF